MRSKPLNISFQRALVGPHDIVTNVMRSTPLNISFRTALVADKHDEWEDLVAKITDINLTNERYLFIWMLHNNDQFMVLGILCISFVEICSKRIFKHTC
jgi:hypothetical protein